MVRSATFVCFMFVGTAYANERSAELVKSFPPRLMIMFAGTSLVFVTSVVWVLGTARWKAIDTQDPGKIFLQEMGAGLMARAPWASRNGSTRELVAQEIDGGVDNCRPPLSGPVAR